MRLYWISVGPGPNDRHPYEKREIWTLICLPREKGYNHIINNISTSQRMPRIACNHQKVGERQRMDHPSELPMGTNPADIYIFYFPPPEL